jgi:hypothetical protein
VEKRLVGSGPTARRELVLTCSKRKKRIIAPRNQASGCGKGVASNGVAPVAAVAWPLLFGNLLFFRANRPLRGKFRLPAK